MSWYSKAWDNTKGYSSRAWNGTKGYASRGYHGTLDLSAGNHWGWSAGAGSLGGAALGYGTGYGIGGGEGAAWGTGIGALGGVGAGLGIKTLGNDMIRGRFLAKTGMAATNPSNYRGLGAKHRGGLWTGIQENWG